MTSHFHFVLHGVRTLDLQKLVHRVTEDAGAGQLQGALDLPGVTLADELQTAKEHRIAGSRGDEPLPGRWWYNYPLGPSGDVNSLLLKMTMCSEFFHQEREGTPLTNMQVNWDEYSPYMLK